MREIVSLLGKRSDAVCNFLEGGRCASLAAAPAVSLVTPPIPSHSSRPHPLHSRSLSVFGKDTKLIYRHYATLYFVFAVDQAESELGILDLIHVFVEVGSGC